MCSQEQKVVLCETCLVRYCQVDLHTKNIMYLYNLMKFKLLTKCKLNGHVCVWAKVGATTMVDFIQITVSTNQ